MGLDKETKPPSQMEQRKVQVHLDRMNTVEVPCDPYDADSARWFGTGEGMGTVYESNEVTALVEGAETFEAMAKAIAIACSTGDYIYMLNWWIDLSIELAPGQAPAAGAASTRLIDLLTNAVANGVQVRAMFWDQPLAQNSSEVITVNGLNNSTQPGANGAAILDNNTLVLGSHHQKILVVRGTGAHLIGFCGGVDFNTDRISSVSRQPGSPMHDVHCQIEGPAAFDLLKIFVERWTDHPDSGVIDAAKGTLLGQAEPVPGSQGDKYVQIGRTYGNGLAHVGIGKYGYGGYSFARTGERTAEMMIYHAISQAQNYIYCQDQYLVDMDCSKKLAAQIPKIKRLIILVPHSSLSDHPHIWEMQKQFIDNLKADKKKVAICYLKEAGARPNAKKMSAKTVNTYNHSKMWIFDDKFAIIGSANCGQRSYTHDSEVTAGIYDKSQTSPCTVHFAHQLRIRLWASHLGLKPADVFDPIGSSAHWLKPSVRSRIGTVNQNAAVDDPNAFSNKYVSNDQAEPFGG